MSYFDIIMQFWREGRIIEAKRLFDQCKEYRNLTEDEEERLGKLFPNPYEQLKELLESPTPELIYMVYQELTRRRI
jgi:hypothetical protein